VCQNYISRFLTRIHTGQERKKGKQLPIKTLYSGKLSFRSEEEIKTFPHNQKLVEFIPYRPTLIIKVVVQLKQNDTNE
jgi:hypothetical protein